MNPKTALKGICFAVALALAGTPLALAEEPVFGTWKVNLAKSKYSPGPAPKSSLSKWESAQGDGFKLSVDIVAGDGATQHWESTGKFDGKDNPVTGNPDADTMAITKKNANTYEIVNKKGGKNTLKGRIVVAADGKTRVTTQTGTNSKGQKVNISMFYEKQ